MTGREVLAAVRPIESFAASVTRMAAVAHAAIRLEEGQAAAETKLAATQDALAVAKAALTETVAQTQGLTVEIAAEREAARHAWDAEAAERTGSLDVVLAHTRQQIENWQAQEREAKERFERTAAELRATEVALVDRVNELKGLAQRLARSAEAVLR